jgi:5'-nucleotidase (lipoprotein e(P4) family)
MKASSTLPLLFAAISLSACASMPGAHLFKAAAPAPFRDSHELADSILWVQTSAEYRADSLAKYAQARAVLDAALVDKTWTAALEQTGNFAALPPAVIMDLDETVFDNSRFQGELVKRRTRYSEALWSQWVNMADAGAVPGAQDFIAYAQSKGVTVIFLSNRTAEAEAVTRANLAKLKIALPTTEDTVLSYKERGETSSDKTSRRTLAAQTHRILMLFGDDLGDFVSAKKSLAERKALVDANAARWGKSWILLANPAYGSWEGALYNYDNAKPGDVVLKSELEMVKGF